MSKTNIIKKLEEKIISKSLETKTIDNFKAGDTVSVKMRILDGAVERITTFEGICVAKNLSGSTSSCVIRKISAGIGIEKTIPLYSPLIVSVKILKEGVVRRSKLTYLRDIKGTMKVKTKRIVSKK